MLSFEVDVYKCIQDFKTFSIIKLEIIFILFLQLYNFHHLQ